MQHVVIGEAAHPGVRGRLHRGLVDRLITRAPRRERSRGRAPRVCNAAARSTRQRASDRTPTRCCVRSTRARSARACACYLGYARGCGTTVAMLDEANRRRQRGTDVVVAAVQTDGRNRCELALGDLEILGGPNSPARDGIVDVDALLRRNPEVACLDDLAGVDTQGRPITESVPRLLRAGMMLIATLHLTDLRSTVDGHGRDARTTSGARRRRRVPRPGHRARDRRHHAVTARRAAASRARSCPPVRRRRHALSRSGPRYSRRCASSRSGCSRSTRTGASSRTCATAASSHRGR